MKKPAFLIASDNTTPEQLKAQAHAALAKFTQAVTEQTPDGYHHNPDQHKP